MTSCVHCTEKWLKNKKKVQFGVEMLKKDLRFWNRVLGNDEAEFNLFQIVVKTYIRLPSNKAFSPRYTVKIVRHGGVYPVIRIEGKMVKYQYKSSNVAVFFFLGICPSFIYVSITMIQSTLPD